LFKIEEAAWPVDYVTVLNRLMREVVESPSL